MKKWFYTFAVNYNYSPSIFETGEYPDDQGYKSKGEAKKAALKSLDTREKKLLSDLLAASRNVSHITEMLNDTKVAKKKVEDA